MTKTKTRKTKTQKLSVLKKRADKVFSMFIRERDGHKCYTCSKQMTKTESQNGHYIPRNYLFYRYDERNCHCQCVGCNVFKKGNLTVYALHLISDYGVDFLRELDANRLRSVGDTRVFLNLVINLYE